MQSECSHCNQLCSDEVFHMADHVFCCIGCQTVFNLLHENQLEEYYQLESHPGLSPDKTSYFEYLDNPDLITEIELFRIKNQAAVEFEIPSMHCISCVWLLEHLYKLNEGILKSEVDFGLKVCRIYYDHTKISLRQVAELLNNIGYLPKVDLNKKQQKPDRKPIAKLVVAGICFGNIMLFSFPAYFGLKLGEHTYFQLLNFLFILPIFFYSGSEYAKSFLVFFKTRKMNLDVPIYLGMIALFAQSFYELVTQQGHGYWDSLAGLVFFLLLGRTFQNYSFKTIAFDRDYKSFFPVWALKYEQDQKFPVPIDQLKVNDLIEVRHHEIIPCDSILLDEQIKLDYSFVNGESEPVTLGHQESIFAGARVLSGAAKLKVKHEISRSYLTSLWQDIGKRNEEDDFSAKLSKVFTPSLIVIALIAAFFSDHPVSTFTAVVIVACPCALALSTPLSLGFGMRLLSDHGLFIKKARVIENIAQIDHLVFDKTGTLTKPQASNWSYSGEPLSSTETAQIKSLVAQSAHPLSQSLNEFLPADTLPLENYQESFGKGISASIEGNVVKAGSATWLQQNTKNFQEQEITIEINQKVKGQYLLKNSFRPGVLTMVQNLSYPKALLSGDRDRSIQELQGIFDEEHTHFQQSPKDKLNFIKNSTQRTMMLGDGLNDAGALAESHVGVAIVEEKNSFFPASDALLQAKELVHLPQMLQFSKGVMKVVKLSLTLSLLYNVVGLSLAVTGHLTPLHSAILMPLSSLTIFFTAMLGVKFIERQHFLRS